MANPHWVFGAGSARQRATARAASTRTGCALLIPSLPFVAQVVRETSYLGAKTCAHTANLRIMCGFTNLGTIMYGMISRVTSWSNEIVPVLKREQEQKVLATH